MITEYTRKYLNPEESGGVITQLTWRRPEKKSRRTMSLALTPLNAATIALMNNTQIKKIFELAVIRRKTGAIFCQVRKV